MKDMTVEELEQGMKLVINSDAVDLIGKMAITNTWNELLRRFEDSKCCGNCDKYERDYEDYCCGATRDDQEPHDYCPHWQTDGLTRAEREGK